MRLVNTIAIYCVSDGGSSMVCTLLLGSDVFLREDGFAEEENITLTPGGSIILDDTQTLSVQVTDAAATIGWLTTYANKEL